MDAVPPDLWAEWRAYDRIEPIGPRRTDVGFAMVTAAIYNFARGMAGEKDPVTVEEMMPEYGLTEDAQQAREAERMTEQFMQVRRKLGG